MVLPGGQVGIIDLPHYCRPAKQAADGTWIGGWVVVMLATVMLATWS
jgi:hypothetical protein